MPDKKNKKCVDKICFAKYNMTKDKHDNIINEEQKSG